MGEKMDVRPSPAARASSITTGQDETLQEHLEPGSGSADIPLDASLPARDTFPAETTIFTSPPSPQAAHETPQPENTVVRSNPQHHGDRPNIMPERIGPYAISGELGRGGMGIVYLGRDATGGKVAVKVLRSDANLDPVHALHELRILEKLEHENLPRLIGSGITENGDIYMVTQCLEGRNLGEIIAMNSPAARELSLDLIEQGLEALEHAHDNDMIHLDIKPENIFCDESIGKPRACVLDFGLARTVIGSSMESEVTGLTLVSPEELSGERALVQTDSALFLRLLNRTRFGGTLGYMAPEVFRADIDHPVDYRADIYSMGAVLYQALTGESPVNSRTKSNMANAETLQSTLQSCGVGSSLSAVCCKALARSADKRFQTAEEMAIALRTARLIDESLESPPFGSHLQNQHLQLQDKNETIELPRLPSRS